MSASNVHAYQCQYCGRTYAGDNRLTEVSDFHPCPNCGLTQREGSFGMQEELANMFNHNMTLSSQQQIPEQVQLPAELPRPYSISQHYHHSAHVVISNPAPSEPILSPIAPAPTDIIEILRGHNIEPACLLASQLRLFGQAAPDQRFRLVELWRISPPTYAGFGAQELADELGEWQHTTIAQEEEMAKLRLQRDEANKDVTTESIQMDQDNEQPSTNNPTTGSDSHTMEPYITSGYEALAERDYNRQAKASFCVKNSYFSKGSVLVGDYQPALDPVFQDREWWRLAAQQQPIEHQYGMFDQMNQFRPVTETVGGDTHVQEDEEML